jgi:CDP-diacylglycerol--glycerol-3-phosphate 3-phosphatidyltransferase
MTPANYITLTRMLCAPIVFGLVYADASWPGFILYVLGLATDAVDGRLARATGSTTPFGRAMDSTADKALVAAAMLGLLVIGELPAWLAFLFVLREFMIFGLRNIRTPDGFPIAEISDRLGRVRFFVLHAGLVLLLVPSSPGQVQFVGLATVTLATIMAYIGFGYYVHRDRAALYANMKGAKK